MVSKISIVALALFACATAARSDPSPQPSASAATAPAFAIAFDEVDRTIGGSATAPPPGSFAADVQLAIDETNATSNGPSRPNLGSMAISMIPVFGTIYSMGQAKKAKQQADLQRQMMMDKMMGNKISVTSFAFYNGWTRVQTANSIVITKPDQHLTIFIDPQAKTYRTYDTSSAVSVSPAAVASIAPAGTSTASSLYSTTEVDPATVGGEQVSGFSAEVIETLSGSTGACHDGTVRAKELLYFSAEPEPPTNAPVPASLDQMALPDGCTATIERQSTAADAPVGQMYVYRLFTVVRDPNAPVNQQPSADSFNPSAVQPGASGPKSLPPNYMILSERGNFRTLTAADAPLFDIPQGYAQDR